MTVFIGLLHSCLVFFLKALHLEITFYNKITPVRQRCIDVVFIDEVKSTAYGSTSGCGLIHTHVMVWVILIVKDFEGEM